MIKKEITLAGVQYPVQFDLDTIMLFEEIVEHSFFADEFKTLKSQMALTVAAALSADTLAASTIAFASTNSADTSSKSAANLIPAT